MFLEIYYCESPLSTRRRPYQGPSQGTVKLYEGSLTALICVSSRMSVSSSLVYTDSDGIQSPGSVMSRPQQQHCNYTDPLSILPVDHLI